jgi:ComF family protein
LASPPDAAILRDLLPEYPAPTILERGLDLIFPPTCVGCRKIGRWICTGCWQKVHWLGDIRCGTCDRHWIQNPCPHCTGRSGALAGMAAAAAFDGPAREAVHALKYQGRHAIGRVLGVLMARMVPPGEHTMVAPVPLHPRRKHERGYDQAAILARHVARRLDLPVESAAARRVRHTKQQANLSGDQRARNVAGAFVAEDWVQSEHVLLIDDVYTTGATLEACAAALRDAGAASVTGLVFAAAL